MMTTITPDQARALAALVASIRTDWDPAGTYAAIVQAKDRGDVYELTIATIRAASTRTNRTPAVIAMTGPHWTTTSSEPHAPSTVPRAGVPRCPVDAHDAEIASNCRTCRALWLETGWWPAGSQHTQATTATTRPPDHAERAAHDEETR